MKILVTGANGYIGSKVVTELLNSNIEVIATDFCNEYIDSRATFIKADIFDLKVNWMDYFDNPDVCLHLAWRDGFVHNSINHIKDLSNHFLFLKNLIDNGVKKIVVMGTMHEIGYHEGAIDENTPCSPLSLYGISKNALRQALTVYTTQKNCMFEWLRAYYIYGDDTHGNSIFCKIRQAVKRGETLFPFTSGTNKYDFIHIDELSKQIAKCAAQDRILGIINVCSGVPVSLAEKMEWYIKDRNLPIKLDYGKFPDRPYDSHCVYGDNTKIKIILEE